jgi:hypothetical protein
MDVAVEKRRQRRLNRIEDKRQEIEAEGRSVLPGQRFDDLGVLSRLNSAGLRKKSIISSSKPTAMNI